MRVRIKIRILACLAIMIAICMMSGCMSRKEQDRRNEELVAAYPEEVKAYLEERYGCEFCVNPKRRGGAEAQSLLPRRTILPINMLHMKMRKMVMPFGQKYIRCH